MKIKISKASSFIVFLIITAEVINNSIATILFPIPNLALQASIYGSMFLILTLFLKGIHIEWRMLLVVFAAGMSLIMNSIEAKYNAPFRLGSWILMISTVGPLVYSPLLLRFRDKLLEGFFIIFMLIGGISFIYWLSGLPSIGRGHFSGLMNHSMALAPVAALGGLYAFHKFIQEPKGKKNFLFLGLFIFSTFDVVLAASRTALVGYALGFMIFVLFSKFRLKKLIIFMLTILTIILASRMDDSVVDISGTDSVTSEMISRGLTNTRETLWNDRILEFKSSPVFGVGFATQDDTVSAKEGKEGGRFGGKVEPGSTYLMILSMTGFTGAIALLWFFLKPLFSKRFWRRISSVEGYKLAAFAFFSVHFVAEGYIYSSGSLSALVFWLLVGATYPYSGVNYEKVLGKK